MFALILTSLFAFSSAANWAVLVAGSNGFGNYRHQSDIFRTYKVLTKNGFDPSKIIVMAYDDIAASPSNPFPGKVFNVPDGPDVYIGSSNINYRGSNVTAEQFYAVITGDKTKAKSKVLESTSNDNVFIFFDDHGSANLICFPSGPYAYADDINEKLKIMHEKKMYKNLLIYIEACYSGSLFLNKLPTDMNIYAVTAANEKESSWGTYCGIAKYKTCLSNEFSQNWMQHSDSNNLKKITVGEQFDHVKAATVKSHVCEFGTVSIKRDILAQYQSGSNSNLPDELLQVVMPLWIAPPRKGENKQWKTLSQTDAYMSYLETASESNQFSDEAASFHKELLNKEQAEARSYRLASHFGQEFPSPNYEQSALEFTQIPLYRKAIETYEAKLGRLNEHSLWDHTNIINRAIAEGVLNESNFSNYETLLATL